MYGTIITIEQFAENIHKSINVPLGYGYQVAITCDGCSAPRVCVNVDGYNEGISLDYDNTRKTLDPFDVECDFQYFGNFECAKVIERVRNHCKLLNELFENHGHYKFETEEEGDLPF